MLLAQSRQPLPLGSTQWRCLGCAQWQAGKSAVSFLKYSKKFFLILFWGVSENSSPALRVRAVY